MKRKLFPLVFSIAVLAASTPSHAVIVDFDGAVDSTGIAFYPLLTHNDYLINNGYYVGALSTKTGAVAGADLVGVVVDGNDTASAGCGDFLVCPTNNTGNYLIALNDGLIDVQSTLTGSFFASQFSASFIAVVGDTVPGVSMILQVEGYSTTAQVFTQQFQLPGPTAGAYSFATYSLNSTNASTPIVELAFRGYVCNAAGSCNRTSDKAQFALDNVVLTAVPEPSQWLLMGLGLAALGGLARRNTRAGA